MSETPRPKWLPELDLRSVTRNSNRAETRVYVILNHVKISWIRCGLLCRVETETKHQWIGAHLTYGITDESDASAYAFHIDVVGLQLSSIHFSVTQLRGWVASAPGDGERFLVPPQPQDLSQLPWCRYCKGEERHPTTTFTPAPHLALWEKLRGVELCIELGPVIPEDER